MYINVQYFNLAHAYISQIWTLLALYDFFLALFLSFPFALSFSLSSTPHILSVTRKKLGGSAFEARANFEDV